MKKPTFLKKLVSLTQHSQSWLLNPESPLFVFKKYHYGQAMDEMRLQNTKNKSNIEQNQQNKHKNQLIFPKSNRLKQQLTNPLSRLLQEQEKIVKQSQQKYQKKRIKTVPYENYQKYKYLQQTKEHQIKPVLLITQMKSKQSQSKQKYQKINHSQKMNQICINLQDNQKISSIKIKQNIKTIEDDKNDINLISQKDGNHEPAKTIHSFHKQKERKNRNKSIFVQQIIFKPDATLKQKVRDKKILSLCYSKPFEPPKNISAKSYIIYRISSNRITPKMIYSENSKNRQQIASLTKIMTAILVIEICKRYSIDKYAQEVTITSFQTKIGGTTASIKKGQIYTIEQLLFGLMLPSGNDASLALATWAGSKLLEDNIEIVESRQDNDKKKTQQSQQKIDEMLQMKQKCYKRFIEEMNVKAKELKMKKTTYANSHGLSNGFNKSCALDIAILCDYCMQNQTFRNIVRTKKYQGYIKKVKSTKTFESSCTSAKRSLIDDIFCKKASVLSESSAPIKLTQINVKQMKVQWQNTHDLVKRYPQEYIGIKTGITYTAGPCLSSCFSHNGRQYVIILLNCESSSMRFRDTQALKKWFMDMQPIKSSISSPKQKKLISLTQKVNFSKLGRKS